MEIRNTSRRIRRRLLPASLALLASLAAVSCGSGAGSSKNQTSSDLTMNKDTLDFGSVPVGDNKSSSLTLSNSSANGSPSVTISQISASGSSFSATLPNLPLVLMPGQSSHAYRHL